jgi:hypothetical protein
MTFVILNVMLSRGRLFIFRYYDFIFTYCHFWILTSVLNILEILSIPFSLILNKA